MSEWASIQISPIFCLPAAIELRHARHRSGRQRVVAAQQQRSHARFQRRHHGFGRARAGFRNLLQIVGIFAARRLRFRNLDADIAGVRYVVAERLQPRLQAGHAHRGWPHVHAAAARAQVQRHPDHANAVRWLHRAAGRIFAGSGGIRRWFTDCRHTHASLEQRGGRASLSVDE